ncbi:MAG: metalloregulator ArsR/SmtB family transcription factor [Actinomycetota bacterium]|nr:metalloregulator ArsR/SmtB family transcription factor [Actinomycetota bacterium]
MAYTAWTALADPHRRAAVALLRERPRTVGELTVAIGCSQPGTSKHLRVLREAGLVRVTPDAQRRVYALAPGPLAELDAWLAPYRALWEDRLDALGVQLDRGRPGDATDSDTTDSDTTDSDDGERTLG